MIRFDPHSLERAACPRCQGKLAPARTCARAYLRCADCGRREEITDHVPELDDDFEEQMANLPLDRC
ncbi:dual CXXC motif small (seleno)protein [Desulfohalovibrio reitneri]|uniref:dual CXXC motif small (seleno)protein n=1 Tax=Desulfohalovibrio reitneri TaxID=1307759 RepID=UPI0004A6E25F|nr:dual CXXC motif small (seleno)protein [Desulfohalovibrio reitneri]